MAFDTWQRHGVKAIFRAVMFTIAYVAYIFYSLFLTGKIFFIYFRYMYKGRFTRYNFYLQLSHAIFIARAARVMEKSYTIFTI